MTGVTDDPSDPGLSQEDKGLHDTYLVLSEQERKQGFVRSVRRSYVHVGREICGIPDPSLNAGALERGFLFYVCSNKPDHDGECDSWLPIRNEKELARFRATGFLGGCGGVTTMGLAIAETYARKPDFYGRTYCGRCDEHFNVGEWGEFVWADERGQPMREKVGT